MKTKLMTTIILAVLLLLISHTARAKVKIVCTITDLCDNPLSAAVDVTLHIQSGDGLACPTAFDVTYATSPLGLTGTFDDDPATAGSCYTGQIATPQQSATRIYCGTSMIAVVKTVSPTMRLSST